MNTRVTAVHALEERLGYQFKDRELLERALTHASVGEGATKVANNEVLEFLGDRVLGAHLAGQVGRVHRVLTEGPRLGRTEGFAEVDFGADQPEGRVVEAVIRGVAGGRLVA